MSVTWIHPSGLRQAGLGCIQLPPEPSGQWLSAWPIGPFRLVALSGVLRQGRLLSGSEVVAGTSRDQAGDEGAEQGFAALACVVHDLEEAEAERQLVLRDAAVRAQPGA